jgi:hypothetical protein
MSGTAVVQIAYADRIYILQVGDLQLFLNLGFNLDQVANMVAEKRLPANLRLLLSHPRILKAGPFVGRLDLAKYAKDRHVVTKASSIKSESRSPS